MSVPMSLDEDLPMSLDDDADMEKVERRIRKEKEMFLDDNDDDYATLEKIKRKKKVLYIDDVDVAVRLGRMTRIDNFPPDGVRGKIENQRKISDDDLKFPSTLSLWHMELRLPAMARTFRTKDWSLLRKYCFLRDSSSTEKNLSLEEALKHELVATCFYFLFTKTCPPHVKECLVSALEFIFSMSPKATNMPIDQEEGVDHAPRKMSIDQASIEALMVDALRLGDKEIVRQVCQSIVEVVVNHMTDTVGSGIQSELVEVACSFPLSCDTRVATCLLGSINVITSYFKGGEMREKLVEAVLYDTEWLLKFMRDPDEGLVQEAYNILVCITRGGYNDDAGIWEALLEDFIPQILKRNGQLAGNSLCICAARVITNTINGGSVEQIEELVYDQECLILALLEFLDIREVRRVCMVAIENILKADEEESCYNIYAMKICEHLEKSYLSMDGWDLLHNEAKNSEDILVKYAPDKWLRRNSTLWYRREKMAQK